MGRCWAAQCVRGISQVTRSTSLSSFKRMRRQECPFKPLPRRMKLIPIRMGACLRACGARVRDRVHLTASWTCTGGSRITNENLALGSQLQLMGPGHLFAGRSRLAKTLQCHCLARLCWNTGNDEKRAQGTPKRSDALDRGRPGLHKPKLPSRLGYVGTDFYWCAEQWMRVDHGMESGA